MNFKKAGDKNLASDHNQMIREIRRLQAKVSDSVWSHPFAGNNQINPLTIKQGTAADKFKIVVGYVNLVMPTLGGVAINSPVSPATTPATPEFTVTETTQVFIKCVGTFGSPDTYVVTIETSTTSTGQGDPPTGTEITGTGFTSFYYIGSVEFTDNSPDPNTFVITNFHTGGNLGVDSFGLYNVWWRA